MLYSDICGYLITCIVFVLIKLEHVHWMSLGKNPRKECNFFTVAMKEPLKPGRKYEIRVENRGCSTD